MKNLFFTSILCILSITKSFSQTNTFPDNGNVGIGTTSPKDKLDVNGNILISNSAIPMGLITEIGGSATPLLNMSVNFRESNLNSAYIGAAFRIDTRTTTDAPLFQWISRQPGSLVERINMVLTSDGVLGIGLVNPQQGDKLAVNGLIRAREVKVENNNWPDYVFTSTHKLPSMGDIEKYIDQNKHLPDIPSANEIKNEGLKLGEINALLLKKIEELTLYLIKQDKDIQLLKQSNAELRSLYNK